jgi:hypothetical protein
MNTTYTVKHIEGSDPFYQILKANENAILRTLAQGALHCIARGVGGVHDFGR